MCVCVGGGGGGGCLAVVVLALTKLRFSLPYRSASTSALALLEMITR